MPTTDVDICNRALSRLGDDRITTLADPVKAASCCNAAFAFVRDEVLREHPWNSAITRKTIAEVATKAITSTDNLNPLKVFATGHGYVLGQRIFITGVTTMTQINNRFFRVGAPVNANDFTLTSEELVAIDGTTYVDGTGGTARQVPDWDFDHLFQLPTDCLRVLEVQDQEFDDWVVESGFIATSLSTPLHIRYIWRNTTYDLYEPLLLSALAARLASEIAEELTQSTDKRTLAWTEYQRILSKAHGADAQEMKRTASIEDDWISVRNC